MSRPPIASTGKATKNEQTPHTASRRAATPCAPASPSTTPPPYLADVADLIEIGQLTRAHGLKGEIALIWYADSTDWLRDGIWLRAGERGPIRPARVLAFRTHHGQLLIQLEGVVDRSAAEQMRGMSVLIPASRLPESDDESIYLRDLIGLSVVLHATGEPVGTLEHIDFVGEQELWNISSPDGREILFPAVPEFVNDIDLDAEIVRISPPAGLLELYSAD